MGMQCSCVRSNSLRSEVETKMVSPRRFAGGPGAHLGGVGASRLRAPAALRLRLRQVRLRRQKPAVRERDLHRPPCRDGAPPWRGEQRLRLMRFSSSRLAGSDGGGERSIRSRTAVVVCDDTLIRNMAGWQHAAQYTENVVLASICGFRHDSWRRMHIRALVASRRGLGHGVDARRVQFRRNVLRCGLSLHPPPRPHTHIRTSVVRWFPPRGADNA